MPALFRRARERRQRSDEAQPTTSRPVVDGCEYVGQGELALVRVAGTGGVKPITLIVDDGEVRRFEALPEAADGKGDGWRTAFAIPFELVERDARFDLELADGSLLELPAPAPAGRDDAPRAGAGDDAAELADARSKLEQLEQTVAQMRAAEASRAEKLVEAWSECNALREELTERDASQQLLFDQLALSVEGTVRLRDELNEAQRVIASASGGDAELIEARAALERATAELTAERERHAAEQAELQRRFEQLQGQLAAIEDANEQGRRGLLRRRKTDTAPAASGDDRERLEARIAELEREAESFTARRDEAVSESLRERVAELESELKEQHTCADDLRALLESERQQASRTREEMHDLRRQLATRLHGGGEPVAGDEPAADTELDPAPARGEAPWTALDVELLARIEKAKALAGQ